MPLDGELTEPLDDLRGDIAKMMDGAADDAALSISEDTSTEPVAETVAEPKADHPSDPARYADGTFKPIKSDAAPEKAAAPAAKPVAAKAPAEQVQPTTDNAAKASVQPSTAADAPPAGWSAEAKAQWASLSPAVKAAAIKREEDIANGGRQWSDEKRRMQEDIAPLVMRTRELGIDHREGLNQLLAADYALRTQPVRAIHTLMKQFGVTLEQLTGQAQPAASQSAPEHYPQQPLHDPRLDSILAEREQEAARAQARLEHLVTEFASSPDHPHFDAVINEALPLLASIKAAKPYASPQEWLQEAYDRAVWANPVTRQAELNAQAQATEQQRRQSTAGQVARAKAASVSVAGVPGGSQGAAPKDSIREELLAAFDA